jgi:Cys-tRNA(Pro) deacylase
MAQGSWPEAVARVAAFLDAAGGEARLEELAADCATAEGAADAVGCTLGQIVKTLVLMCDAAPVVALVPGDRRADQALIAKVAGARKARIATAAEVREVTGFEPGSVAPFPPARARLVLADQRVLAYPLVWAGAGSHRHMVALAPRELIRLARADVAAVSRESA